MATNCILLLGAGFSKNWDGWLARDFSNDLMARLQSSRRLVGLLNTMNFEDALVQVQNDYLRSQSEADFELLELLQHSISAIFHRMNQTFEGRPFEFSNDISRHLQKLLVRFDAIFTLNQDLLLEIHYRNENVAVWYGTRWNGYEMPGLRGLPLQDPFVRASKKWRPQEPFRETPGLQPYYKLHGSVGWETGDGRQLLVIGRDKAGTIARNPILRWNYQQFEASLANNPTRLMVIGYGFGDDHINETLVQAHQKGTLALMYLVHPAGKAVLNRFPRGTIPGPQPLLEIPCVECMAPISAAFNTDDLARELMERIFS